MSDNVCLKYGPETNQAKAYKILEADCDNSIAELCKKKFSDPDKIQNCIAKPDVYIPENKKPFSFRILERTFSFGTLNACKDSACSYVRQIGTRDILKSLGQKQTPSNEESSVKANQSSEPQITEIEGPEYEMENGAKEIFVDASMTNLELISGKADVKQVLEIDVLVNNTVRRISPKPYIIYTITKNEDKTFEMKYSLFVAGAAFVENKKILFSNNPSMSFRIVLFDMEDFNTIRHIELNIK